MLCNTWLATDRRGEPLHLDPDGRPRYLVRQLVDLREGRHPEDQLAWRATHDALTGLPNRSLFLDRLEMTLARLGRDPALAAVLVLDLDRFREVAERFGDDAVDRLLVAVAGRLRSILRPSDTVARFGSDEFAVLCPDLAHERDAVRLAESCRQAARWRANGPRTLAPTMHVNLSPRQFAEPHLIDLVAGALADTATDPTGSASRSPSAPWPPTRPRPPPPSSASPASVSGSRSTTSAAATPRWPRSSTCRCRRSRSAARSWPASTSTPPTTPWSRPSSASATPSA